jgi:hypothetical protein
VEPLVIEWSFSLSMNEQDIFGIIGAFIFLEAYPHLVLLLVQFTHSRGIICDTCYSIPL